MPAKNELGRESNVALLIENSCPPTSNLSIDIKREHQQRLAAAGLMA